MFMNFQTRKKHSCLPTAAANGRKHTIMMKNFQDKIENKVIPGQLGKLSQFFFKFC